MKWKNAQDLEPGDRIVTDKSGKVETVTDRTERDQYRGCSIYTDQSTILTGLPCAVTLAED